jgi:hypothetical protein
VQAHVPVYADDALTVLDAMVKTAQQYR